MKHSIEIDVENDELDSYANLALVEEARESLRVDFVYTRPLPVDRPRPRGYINGSHIPPRAVTEGTEELRRRWDEDLTTRPTDTSENNIASLHRENHELH